MQDIPLDTKKCGPSSQVLQEIIRQAPAEYVTVGWLTSHRHSFGIVLLCLGLLATTPVGSTLPGLILAVMAAQMIVGRTQPVFPRFLMTRRLPSKQLLWIVQSPETESQNRRYRDLSGRQRPHAPCLNPQKCPQTAGFSSETGKRRFASDCVVGPGGLEPPTRPL
jgi:hypothetical protein